VTNPTLPRLLALAPKGLEGIGVVAAACRASALGIIDCCPHPDGDLNEGFGRLSRLTANPFGVRVLAAQVLDGSWLPRQSLEPSVVWIPVGGDDNGQFDAAVRMVREAGRSAIAEVTTHDDALRASTAGVSGLIVAGHEAGGWGGAESCFVLLQKVLAASDLPVWVRGGIGPTVAAGCVAAGAAGVVLDGALWLARESPLDLAWRERISRWDGSETTVIGPALGTKLRVFALPGSGALARLRQKADDGGEAWESALDREVGWRDGQCLPVGQDAALAADLARKFVTVGGIVQAVDRAITAGILAARAARPLDQSSPLALAHGTRYPILQGPMTRVSDVPPFAEAVARDGGLPFLALALLRAPEVRALLRDAANLLSGRPWGVGILGFVPPELRAEQLAVVQEFRPPFALIAGGRPDQAVSLERQGTATYLHVPSPGLLDQYLRDGCRRFVLEGRECGGHVGPRSSFVLWEQSTNVVAEAIDRGLAADQVNLVFAGGIHDARSAALVAALAGPLAARGVKIGILVGTAYLFTREAVTSGAIVPRFQDEVLRCAETVLLESGPGHQVRVSRTPFVTRFEEERKRLAAEGRSTEEIRQALEDLNVGRLRVATKGIDRGPGAEAPLVAVSAEYQETHGLYMLGQVAALRNQATTVAQLHRDLCVGGTEFLERDLAGIGTPTAVLDEPARPSDIAIIGMAAVLPGAANVKRFWSNTLSGFDAITEVPPDRWDWRLYYDSDPKAPDKIVSKWGGFLPDIPFDPLRYGMPPSSLPSIEPAQLLALEVVRNALADAGYGERPFPREQTAVVLGMGGGAAQLAMGYAFRSYLPMLDTVIPAGGAQAIESCQGLLPEWTEDSFPGFLLNVTAGRIANRFNLGGSNYTVDAACGSSLAAAALAVRELETGVADLVILGGVDTVQNPFTYLAFSKTQAFSPRGRCRPFDAGADGIVISEGVAALVLKRLADAERDGDRIYAVIKGVGASSDGRARGLTAPGVEGQSRALERAYKKAGVSPATIGYVEAHGTGTALGDVVEVEALGRLFGEAGVHDRQCVVGSVKSLIGHAKCAAGLAGLINASLALYHNVLPPTIGIETPNSKLDQPDGPFRLCTQAQPWLHGQPDRPRRAGVSAFGFGGTNFHAVLEAYEGNLAAQADSPLNDWPLELLVWQAEGLGQLLEHLDQLARALDSGARPLLGNLSQTLIQARTTALARSGAVGQPTLVILAGSHDDLRDKLKLSRAAIAEGRASVDDPRGVFFAAQPAWSGEPVAFLFPGQGAQSPGMLRELALAFPVVREAFEEFDQVLFAKRSQRLGPIVFPPPAFDEEARERYRLALMQTDVAQPAVGAACVGMLRLLRNLGCEPDLVAGHSYGELVALHAAGVLSTSALAELSLARGRFMQEAGHGASGAMAALLAGPDDADKLIRDVADARVANWNGPKQTVIAGPTSAVKQAIDLAVARGISARLLPVSCAFHTPLVAEAREPLSRLARQLLSHPPDRPVYSNLDAAPHPEDTAAIAARLGDHLAGPVRFAGMIDAMHRDGARVFVEVGPGSILTPLVESVLRDRPHLAVSSDSSGSPGLPAWLRCIARLVVAGLPVRLERLTTGRALNLLELGNLPPGEGGEAITPSTWLVNGSRARPYNDPEPKRLGMAMGPSPVHSNASLNLSLNSSPRLTNHSPAEPSEGPVTAFPHSSPERNGKPDSQTNMKPSSTPGPRSERVIAEFQQTMRMFLDVQKSTMLAYLAGRGPATTPETPVVRTAFEDRANGASPSHGSAAERREPARDQEVVVAVPDLTLGHGTAPARDEDPVEAAASSGVAAPDRGTITTRLLETVRDRTGYPIETLGLELDMEADLGIDSIKRVEILGKLRDEFPSLKGLAESAETMDALTQARTLGAIVDRMVTARGADGSKSAPRPGGIVVADGDGRHESSTLRRLIEVVEAPLPDPRFGLMPGGRVAIADDGRGVAGNLADCLEAAGVAVDRIGGLEGSVDWTSPSAIEAVLDRIRSRGPLAGLVHALPLRLIRSGQPNELDWDRRVGEEVKGLFLLAKAMAADLEKAARFGGSCLVAATALGGRFASAGSTRLEFFPGHGGIAGLVKTLAREWPSVRCRVVDFTVEEPADTIAGRLADEMFVNDGWAEVGYDRGRRIRLRTIEGPTRHTTSALELKPGEPVVISGGARGITALVATELARTWRPTLLILGTTPLPEERESDDTAALNGEAEIKAALHARLRREGRPGSPADIEKVYQSLRRAREVRENLEVLREAGATAAYSAADVRDPRALARVMADWRGRYGDPVGLIHGAGLIKDKLIRHKTLESFDRVLGTKLDGALNLIRLVRPDSLKFTALFSSIAGRFGNVGQSDYAAANEVLNKLAHWLDLRWPGRVLSVVWGPWSGVGMVSQLESHLGRQGLGMIAPEVGRSLLIDELRYGRKGDVEVIYTGELGTLEQPLACETAAECLEAVS
jgi:acyl transferase domain-containing protein/NAD(P)H-dependent flavin oxidoreductase YrpB (nitropropane dioxygenase family)/acyl carrier protein